METLNEKCSHRTDPKKKKKLSIKLWLLCMAHTENNNCIWSAFTYALSAANGIHFPVAEH